MLLCSRSLEKYDWTTNARNCGAVVMDEAGSSLQSFNERGYLLFDVFRISQRTEVKCCWCLLIFVHGFKIVELLTFSWDDAYV